MGTPANLALLEQAGLLGPEAREARPEDLVLAVEAATADAADAALAAAEDALRARHRPRDGGDGARRPRTLDSALRALPGANVAAISVPGAFATREAARALRHGLHVFLFSDHVPLGDEVRLKREARRRGLLCMGPDCGTAYVGGVGLGFANVVERGRIGCVAASGTGLQAVVCHLAAHGEGVSQGIGVGGRDLSAEVGGEMTGLALDVLAADRDTAVVLLITKPPHPDVLPRLDAMLATVGKPVVACVLGAPARPPVRSTRWVATLADAAEAAVAAARGRAWAPRSFADPRDAQRRLAGARSAGRRVDPGILGLYTGGTLAHEARLVLEPHVGAVALGAAAPGEPFAHRVVDLGDDTYTARRPHPMIDAAARAGDIVAAGETAGVGVLLLDVVLGRGAHPDPAGPVAAAVEAARARAARRGRWLDAVASVVGTARDPQGLHRQVARLEAAGITVLPSNAEAARFAALLLRPELAGALLGPGA
jgi:FdrA protein